MAVGRTSCGLQGGSVSRLVRALRRWLRERQVSLLSWPGCSLLPVGKTVGGPARTPPGHGLCVIIRVTQSHVGLRSLWWLHNSSTSVCSSQNFSALSHSSLTHPVEAGKTRADTPTTPKKKLRPQEVQRQAAAELRRAEKGLADTQLSGFSSAPASLWFSFFGAELDPISEAKSRECCVREGGKDPEAHPRGLGQARQAPLCGLTSGRVGLVGSERHQRRPGEWAQGSGCLL